MLRRGARGHKARSVLSLLEAHQDAGFVTLTLHDPDRRNSLTPELVEMLCHEFDVAEESEDVCAMILTANGRAFCSGADIFKLASHDREGLRNVCRAFIRVAASPLLTIAAVNGPAVGAGMNLALASDIRLAAKSARFDCRFLSLGIHPGGGQMWMLQRAVGEQTAAAMVLASQIVDGIESERLGLVWKCFPDETLVMEAQSLARAAAQNPRELLKRAKASLRESKRITNYDDAVSLELDVQIWSIQQPEFRRRLDVLNAKIAGQR